MNGTERVKKNEYYYGTDVPTYGGQENPLQPFNCG
jgi:hypothetical protein